MKSPTLPPINELYPCIQGEGQYAGVPHILVRTSGCRLRCQFSNSFCDTWYSSWKPEKGKYGYEDLASIYNTNLHIHHTMVTGGGPTLHGPQLTALIYLLVNKYDQFITLETEGSEFVQTDAQFISLSPKLKSSTPVVGTFIPFLDRHVTERDVELHEKFRCNYEAMQQLIDKHQDYQLKPVVSNDQDMEEVLFLQKKLQIPNHKVYLMPPGISNESLQKGREYIVNQCLKHGYRYTDRLHVIIYGDKREV